MRYIMLSMSLFLLSTTALIAEPLHGPAARVAQASVATGTYETYFYGVHYTLEKWLGGDIEILPGGRYHFQNETGSFREAGGEVVWESGPLKDVVTRYKLDSSGKPALIIPRKENEARGNKMAVSDIWGYLR